MHSTPSYFTFTPSFFTVEGYRGGGGYEAAKDDVYLPEQYKQAAIIKSIRLVFLTRKINTRGNNASSHNTSFTK